MIFEVVVWGGCGRFLFHKTSLFVNIKIIVSMECMVRRKKREEKLTRSSRRFCVSSPTCTAAAVPNPVAAAIALLKLSSRCFEG